MRTSLWMSGTHGEHNKLQILFVSRIILVIILATMVIIFSAPIHNHILRHMSVLVCPRFICISSQCTLDRLQPHSLLQLLTLMLCCPLLPQGVGEISGHVILQLHQNRDDLADGCLNFHHFDNSKTVETFGHFERDIATATPCQHSFEFQSP